MKKIKIRWIITLCVCCFFFGFMWGNYNGRNSVEVNEQSVKTNVILQSECNLEIDINGIENKILRLNSSNTFIRFFSPNMTT